MLLPRTQADSVALVEDGFAVKLTEASWNRLLAALTARQTFSLTYAPDTTFEQLRFEVVVLPEPPPVAPPPRPGTTVDSTDDS